MAICQQSGVELENGKALVFPSLLRYKNTNLDIQGDGMIPHVAGPALPGNSAGGKMKAQFEIRSASPSDLEAVIALDQFGPKEEKPDYWRGIFSHYVTSGRKDRLFLVAETDEGLVGFIVGEVRAWEFGSPPCGWVFALTVSPTARELGVGKRMFEEISARLKQAGVTTVRTMVDRDSKVIISFFRSMGMRTGRYIELEKPLD
jgi:ribosomal protein S18 acetylase RimI-like enzyme